jgi:hypothetical protein
MLDKVAIMQEVNGESTKRSRLDADHLIRVLCKRGVAEIMGEKEFLLVMEVFNVQVERQQIERLGEDEKWQGGGLIFGQNPHQWGFWSGQKRARTCNFI